MPYSRSLTALFCLLFGSTGFSAVKAIEDLFTELSQYDKEVESARLHTEFTQEGLKGSKSRLYPSLGLNLMANEGTSSSLPSPSSNLDSGASAPEGSLSDQSSSSVPDLSNATKGWTSQVSLGYFLFTHFAVTEDIHRAENSVKSARLNESEIFEKKKAQLLQVLLEWQMLNQVKAPIEEAQGLVEKVKIYSQKRSGMLYTSEDRANLEEKAASIEYHHVRVVEGLALAEEAIRTALPQMTMERLATLPLFEVSYPLPARDQLRDRYKTHSRSFQVAEMEVDSAKGYKRASDWYQPWIPTVYWSTSYSYSGNYEGQTSDNGISTSLLLSFNLFDGFYTQARHQQSRIAVEAAKKKRDLETDKKTLWLQHRVLTARVAKAEHRLKLATAQKKALRYKDFQRKLKQGIGSRLELSLGALSFVKAQMEALNSLKEYQQASLDIAVELNDWEKVEINER